MKRCVTTILAPALCALLCGPPLQAAQAQVVARDQRDQFAQVTLERCIQSQRAAPTNAAQTDGAIRDFCTCYARRVADAMPDDVLNTSLSAATPEQLTAAQSLMRQSAQACRAQAQP